MMRVIDAYEAFARRCAARIAGMVDGLLAAPRRIRTETFDVMLGADAMPAPVPARVRHVRR